MMVKLDLLPEMKTMTLQMVAQVLGGAGCGGGQPQINNDCRTCGICLIVFVSRFQKHCFSFVYRCCQLICLLLILSCVVCMLQVDRGEELEENLSLVHQNLFYCSWDRVLIEVAGRVGLKSGQIVIYREAFN
jgi:hypothetical protein